MVVYEPLTPHLLGSVGVWQPAKLKPPHHLMSFTCNQVCCDILPRFYKMWVSKSCLQVAAAKEWQYTTQFGYLQPGEVGVVDKRNSGGWHVPAAVVCSVLLGLEKTCTLLLRNHCSELPLSQRASGSCRNAALLGVIPAQKPGGMAVT